MNHTLTMCRARACPLKDACQRHEASGTVPAPHQIYAAVPADLWDDAETAACSGWILAKDTE